MAGKELKDIDAIKYHWYLIAAYEEKILLEKINIS